MAERRMFILSLREGMEKEYNRRHREIWPEMLEMLHAAGIQNYSIWLHDGKVLGYYESENLAATDVFKQNSPVQARWSAYMQDILIPLDQSGTPECVFYMK